MIENRSARPFTPTGLNHLMRTQSEQAVNQLKELAEKTLREEANQTQKSQTYERHLLPRRCYSSASCLRKDAKNQAWPAP
jgi:hypothetical protein